MKQDQLPASPCLKGKEPEKKRHLTLQFQR